MFFCRQVLKMTGLDSQYLVVLCPKLIQALLTALGEAALCRAVRYPMNYCPGISAVLWIQSD